MNHLSRSRAPIPPPKILSLSPAGNSSRPIWPCKSPKHVVRERSEVRRNLTAPSRISLRELPCMTSAQKGRGWVIQGSKFANEPYKICRQTGPGKGQKIQKILRMSFMEASLVGARRREEGDDDHLVWSPFVKCPFGCCNAACFPLLAL